MRNRKEIEKLIKEQDFNWLGRKEFIKDFSDFILSQEESQHICINGVWGSGKTTTILGLIDYLSNDENITERPLILYLDAWKFEHYDHPLFSLLKVMENEMSDIFEKIKSNLSKRSFEVQAGMNIPILSINVTSKNDSSVSRILSSAEYVDMLNEMMIEAVKEYKVENSNKLIIFIDELDRARPEFALRTIEMFHHLQDNLPTHVIYSVDMDQLNSLVKHYYGYEYNVEIFSHKVFDTTISLKKLTDYDLKEYIHSALTISDFAYSIDGVTEIIFTYMTSSQMESLRTINKVCEKIASNLENGYFKKANNVFNRSDYYLGGSQSKNLWGYVEILIAMQILFLTEPLSVRSIIHGNKIEILLEYLLEHKREENRIDVWELIADSYNYGVQDISIRKNSADLDRDNMLLGLRRLFVPPPPSYDNKSVFDEIEL